MTVWENLSVGAYIPPAWKDRTGAMEEMMEIFPILKERRAQLAGTLSGGEQQMCAIARAMISRPRCSFWMNLLWAGTGYRGADL